MFKWEKLAEEIRLTTKYNIEESRRIISLIVSVFQVIDEGQIKKAYDELNTKTPTGILEHLENYSKTVGI